MTSYSNKIMFKLIASSYGENATATLMMGQLIVNGFDGNADAVTHDVQRTFGAMNDIININKEIQSVDSISEEELSRKKVKGAALAVAGSVLLGPLGIAAYFMGGKHENNVVKIITKKGAVIIANVSKEVRAKLIQGAMASELYVPVEEKDFFEDLDPLIVKAIESAEERSLCKKEDLDLNKCRKSRIDPGKVLLVKKSGRKIGLIEP